MGGGCHSDDLYPPVCGLSLVVTSKVKVKETVLTDLRSKVKPLT